MTTTLNIEACLPAPPNCEELAAWLELCPSQIVCMGGGVFKIVDDLEYPCYYYSWPTCPWPLTGKRRYE